MPRSPDALSPRDMVRAGLCVGCGACTAGGPGRMAFDRYGQLKPTGPRRWYDARTEAFARACPFSPAAADEDAIAAARFGGARHADARIGRFEAAYVGHAAEDGFRMAGSSGGMASWVAAELLRRGRVDAVAHVGAVAGPGEPLFRYRLSRNETELRAGAKSRYYPVELSTALEEMRAIPGRYAIIGVPCFVKAVRLAAAQDPALEGRVAYTLGLVCGHMKSARMAESFGWQVGGDGRVEAIDFRAKDASRPANWYAADVTLPGGERRRRDWWHMVDGDWGAGFFQNSACDACDDVTAETADIVFGDAWVEPYSSDGQGTNVVVARTVELDALLREGIAEGRLALSPVDADFVHATQAAGFRQRREGLSFRLSRRRGRVRPVKRVAAKAPPLPARRRAVYRLRGAIAAWSHRMFLLARLTRRPAIYLAWAKASLAVYQGVCYSRGRIGAFLDRYVWRPEG